jgi:hypothetical protein
MQFHQLRRREFITLLGSMAVSWPLAARAQQPERMRRIGVLMGYPESDSEARANIVAFREGLEKLGWVEDRNIRFDTRWATPEDAEARQRFAKELVALQPDLILSHTTPTTAALLAAARTAGGSDPRRRDRGAICHGGKNLRPARRLGQQCRHRHASRDRGHQPRLLARGARHQHHRTVLPFAALMSSARLGRPRPRKRDQLGRP